MRRRTSDSQLDENDTANRIKKELRESFLKPIIIVEPPPPSSESGSSSGDSESGVKHIHYVSTVNVLLSHITKNS